MAKPKNTATNDFDSDVQAPARDFNGGSELAPIPPNEFDARLAALSDWDSFVDEAAGMGLKRVQVDVAGYWEATMSPIFGVLMGVAKAIETELGVTGIYAIKLLRPCAVRLTSKQDGDVDILEPGAIVGVFHSVGLNPLKNMAGAKVAIRRLPKTKLSGNREMWNYDIIGDGVRSPLEIIDNRTPENTGAPF